MRDDADPAADFEAQKAFTPWTSVYNVSGQPAISIPTGVSPEGLPVGVVTAINGATPISSCHPTMAASPSGQVERLVHTVPKPKPSG